MIQYFIEKPLLGDDNLIMVVENTISFVPTDPSNSDYQQYTRWLEEGNTPEEWNPDNIDNGTE